MAEIKNAEEAAFPTKRKADLSSPDLDNPSLKAPKIVPEETIEPRELNQKTLASGNGDSSDPVSKSGDKEPEIEAAEDDDGDCEEEDKELGASGNGDSADPVSKSSDKEPEIDAEEDDDGDCEEEDEDDENENENGDAPVDRKGKGILIEEDEDSDDDDDDSSYGGGGSDGESDLSDDPLAEVDLDNILPSRTRRRDVQPGVYIANELGNKGGEDDSDDSDAA